MATGKETHQPMETDKSSRASSVLTTASGTSAANSEVLGIHIVYISGLDMPVIMVPLFSGTYTRRGAFEGQYFSCLPHESYVALVNFSKV